MILGIDEVGRGPWAGPLVVGAVVLPPQFDLDGLTDSKKLSHKKRVNLDTKIRSIAPAYGLGWVHADELDAVGLSHALKLATIRAIEKITVPIDEIIIDGTVNFLRDTSLQKRVTTMTKADLLVPSVSAASIIAKVARDNFMYEQDKTYPEYGFGTHVGYGTLKHRHALDTYGVTPLHRRSFAPIATLLSQSKVQQVSYTAVTKASSTPTTKDIGNQAEEKVARWLQAQGYTIVERNWKTRYCEIDIIADNSSGRYFIEVKYRRSSQQGGGMAAITYQKKEKMRFAANVYVSSHPTNKPFTLAVVAFEANTEMKLLEIE